RPGRERMENPSRGSRSRLEVIDEDVVVARVTRRYFGGGLREQPRPVDGVPLLEGAVVSLGKDGQLAPGVVGSVGRHGRAGAPPCETVEHFVDERGPVEE